MIVSFADKDTADLFAGKRVKRYANILAIAERKLQQLDSVVLLDGLRAPPGNRLEKLSGDRQGQHMLCAFLGKAQAAPAFDHEVDRAGEVIIVRAYGDDVV